MIQKTYSQTTTEISREKIWQLMSDVNQWKTWDESIDDASLDGEFKTGSQFMLKPKGGPKVRIRLTDVRPDGYFKDQTSFPLAKMHGEHWYEETPEGLKITTTMTMTGLLARLWYKMVMKDIAANLASDINTQISAAKKLGV